MWRIDREFLKTRVKDAWEYRKKTVDTSSCRIIFGEADFLPGLVVDKFSQVLVVQSLALGIDRMKETIVEVLKEVLAEDGIQIQGVLRAERCQGQGPGRYGTCKRDLLESLSILWWRSRKNGVKYQVDVKDGQKTGYFSWTRNITVWQSRSSAKAPESWIALLIQVPLP